MRNTRHFCSVAPSQVKACCFVGRSFNPRSVGFEVPCDFIHGALNSSYRHRSRSCLARRLEKRAKVVFRRQQHQDARHSEVANSHQRAAARAKTEENLRTNAMMALRLIPCQPRTVDNLKLYAGEARTSLAMSLPNCSATWPLRYGSFAWSDPNQKNPMHEQPVRSTGEA